MKKTHPLFTVGSLRKLMPWGCFLFLTLLFADSSIAIGDEQKNLSSGLSQEQPDFPESFQGMVTGAKQIDILSKQVEKLIQEKQLDEAIAIQRRLPAMCEKLGDQPWRTSLSKCYLKELEYIVNLPEDQKEIYFSAKQAHREGKQRVLLGDNSAASLFEKALDSYDKLFKEETLSVVRTLTCLGGCRTTILGVQDFPKAREYLLRATSIQKKLVEEDEPDKATHAALIGITYFCEKDFDQAEAYFREALSQCRTTYGTNSMQYADYLVWMSGIMVEKNKLLEAGVMFHRANDITKAYPPSPLFQASLWLASARVQMAYGDNADAEKSLLRAIKVRKKCDTPNERSFVEILECYANLLRKLDRSDEAQIIEIRAKAFRDAAVPQKEKYIQNAE